VIKGGGARQRLDSRFSHNTTTAVLACRVRLAAGGRTARQDLNVCLHAKLRNIRVQLKRRRYPQRCHRIRAHSNGTATPERCGITRAV
jgi:hypothetical protein